MDNPLLLPKSARDPYANPARDYSHSGAATDQFIAVNSGFLRESLRGLWTILEMQTLPCVPYTNPYGLDFQLTFSLSRFRCLDSNCAVSTHRCI